MDVFKKPKSKFYWYDFTVRGERYRGSTKETADKIAALVLADAIKGSDALDKKPPTLREYSKEFLDWVDTGRLAADSRRYYRNGWRLLKAKKIAGKTDEQDHEEGNREAVVSRFGLERQQRSQNSAADVQHGQRGQAD